MPIATAPGDIYALGATLYRAISGRRPVEATERQLHDDQPPAARIAKGRYRDTFLKAVDCAMKLPPRERPQSIADWRNDLLEQSSRGVAPAMTRILTGRTKLLPEPMPERQFPLNRWIAAPVVSSQKFLSDRRSILLLLAGAVLVASLLTAVVTLLVTSWIRPTQSPRQEDLRMRVEPKQNRLSEAGEAWDAIKDTTNAPVLDAFITRYKDTFYAELARARIAELKKQQATTMQVPEPARPKAAYCDGVAVTVSKERKCIKPGSGKSEWFKDCSDCPEMVVLPSGEFMMGAADGSSDERPVHKVTIAKPFAVGRFEITVNEYIACVAARACRPPEWNEAGNKYNVSTNSSDFNKELAQALRDPRHPVVGVSWDNTKEYVTWLSKNTDTIYRLLTEAEWEYAVRAGSSSNYTWGNEVGRNRANCDGCGSQWDNKRTAPVGSFAANGFGLHDMHGNVWEWVEDCYQDSYTSVPTDGSAAWSAATCSNRVLRGGAWSNAPRSLRSAIRYRYNSDYRSILIGFRVARTL